MNEPRIPGYQYGTTPTERDREVFKAGMEYAAVVSMQTVQDPMFKYSTEAADRIREEAGKI